MALEGSISREGVVSWFMLVAFMGRAGSEAVGKTWISNNLRLENEAREFVDMLEGWARAWIRYSGLEKYPGGKK